MLILYAGDSPVGGPANYLLAILRYLRAEFVHLPPSAVLETKWLKHRYDAILLSDFSRKNMPEAAQKAVASQVKYGTGLAMIGGWGSFSGPFGGWKDSLIEELLPVTCSSQDDRTNFPGGALALPSHGKHLILNKVSFKHPPVICGLNAFQPKKNAHILLRARKLILEKDGESVAFEKKEYPLLVTHPSLRTAALATDAAPHWCGGMVDWGSHSIKLPVQGDISVEVGDLYVQFFASFIQWLASSKQ